MIKIDKKYILDNLVPTEGKEERFSIKRDTYYNAAKEHGITKDNISAVTEFNSAYLSAINEAAMDVHAKRAQAAVDANQDPTKIADTRIVANTHSGSVKTVYKTMVTNRNPQTGETTQNFGSIRQTIKDNRALDKDAIAEGAAIQKSIYEAWVAKNK